MSSWGKDMSVAMLEAMANVLPLQAMPGAAQAGLARVDCPN